MCVCANESEKNGRARHTRDYTKMHILPICADIYRCSRDYRKCNWRREQLRFLELMGMACTDDVTQVVVKLQNSRACSRLC